jgi:hypothetical protein
MPTLEEVRERIKRNFPNQTQSDAKRQKLLEWNRETMNTLVTSCGRFRIHKAQDSKRETFDYTAYTIPGAGGPARKVAGPYLTPKECRDAVQDFVNGEPMQADLT